MDTTRAIQTAVARADLIISRVLALPWKRMALSVVLAWVLIHVCKAVITNER